MLKIYFIAVKAASPDFVMKMRFQLDIFGIIPRLRLWSDFGLERSLVINDYPCCWKTTGSRRGHIFD